LTDGEAADMRAALEALAVRVRRIERRLNDLEPETLPGVVDATPAGVPRVTPAPAPARNALDALSDALDVFGFGEKD
jgi:hypothetical protein